MITADNVRRLLGGHPDTVLVLIEGRIEVVDPAALDTDEYRGALQVITRAELVEQAWSLRASATLRRARDLPS